MNRAPEPSQFLPLSLQLNGDIVVDALAAWFAAEGRAFPWRLSASEVRARLDRGEDLGDPYIVLVSEVMLQQTQTSRVATMLPAFLSRFPTVASLASATRGEVVRAWQGLGYNNRALRLQQAASAIVQVHGGVFPRTVKELKALPGIGSYTAAAIACFAFGATVPVVDVNIRRVLSRIFHRCHTVDARMPEEAIARVDAALLREGEAYWWHQALMDLGATICTARRPACERCPLVEHCLSAFPLTIVLYDHDSAQEPAIASAPRRVWRGRIVELLRAVRHGLAIGDLIDALPNAEALTGDDREQLHEVVGMLLAEGMLVAESSLVREGERPSSLTVVALPT